MTIDVEVVETSSLGDRSYLAHDGEVAVVVDPQRDIDRVLDLAGAAGVRITHVFETHIHNDYVTGGLALAPATGAAYLVNGRRRGRVRADAGRATATWSTCPAQMRLRVLAHPGAHLPPPVLRAARAAGGGGRGGVHRRVAAVRRHGPHRPARPGAHRRAGPRPVRLGAPAGRRAARGAQVLPTHGFGSFCSATQSDGDASTIGEESAANPALTLDEQRLRRPDCSPGWTPTPPTTRTWAPATPPAPAPLDLTAARPRDPDELRRRIEAGEWVVDLRHAHRVRRRHLAGTLNFGLTAVRPPTWAG